jgi:hypothetical protein
MEKAKQIHAWMIEGAPGAGIAGPVVGSIRYRSSCADWQPTDAKGFWIKPLFGSVAEGEKTLLMKVDPGAYAAMHAHPGELEQIYVLEAPSTIGTGLWSPVTIAVAPPGRPMNPDR